MHLCVGGMIQIRDRAQHKFEDFSALIRAALNNDIEIVRTLLEEGRDLHARKNDGTIALMITEITGWGRKNDEL